MESRLSILIITYNRVADTLALLENLKEQKDFLKYAGEVLLLNNASTDSYIEVEEFISRNQAFPVRYIKSDTNLGVSGGRNLLIREAAFPYLLVLDDDVILRGRGALKDIMALWSKPRYIENNTAVITLNIHYFETGERQKTALPHKNYHEYKLKDWFFTYYFTGAAHTMKKELFDKTGYYPEDFFYGMEEYDLSFRVIDAGYTLAYDSDIVVFHKESPLGRVTKREKMAMMWFNKCKVAWRYLPAKYFYSTAILWTLEYWKKTNFDIAGTIATWKKIGRIPRSVKKQKISPSALRYLKRVKARLWY